MNEIDRLNETHDADATGYARAYLDYVGRMVRALDAKTIGAFIALLEDARVRGASVFFIGNGGSAAISSHLAIDYLKNGGLRTMALNDAPTLTALGNDLGYDQVFAKQLDMHADPGDLVIAISSSGRSPNILNGIEAARARQCGVITYSGFGADTPLRRSGDVNFYIRSGEYGFVEVAHLALCHASFDIAMGWNGNP